MPFIFDAGDPGLVIQNAAAAGAQQRYMQDAEVGSMQIRDRELVRANDQRDRSLDQDQTRIGQDDRRLGQYDAAASEQRRQFDLVQDIARREREATAAALGNRAAGGGAGMSPGRGNNVGQTQGPQLPPAAPNFADMDPSTQIRVDEAVRERTQDAQDVRRAQLAIRLAAQRGMFGSATDPRARAKFQTMLAMSSSPAGAREVIGLLQDEFVHQQRARERISLERVQGEYGLEREREQQRGQTERERMQQANRTDTPQYRAGRRDAVRESQRKQFPRGDESVLDGRVDQWVETGKMEDAPTLSVSGETKSKSPIDSPQYKALKARADRIEGKIRTLGAQVETSRQAEALIPELDAVYEQMARYENEAIDAPAGTTPQQSGPKMAATDADAILRALAQRLGRKPTRQEVADEAARLSQGRLQR